MKTVIILLIGQLIQKDIIDLAFSWENQNFALYILNGLSILIGLGLFTIHYFKLNNFLFQFGCVVYTLLTFELQFQQTLTFGNMFYSYNVLILMFIVNNQSRITRIISHIIILYMGIRMTFLIKNSVHNILLIIIAQPLDHLIMYYGKAMENTQYTQTFIYNEFTGIKEHDYDQESDTKREMIKHDIDESVIMFCAHSQDISARKYKSIGSNKDFIDQRIITKKSPDVQLKVATNISDTNQLDSLNDPNSKQFLVKKSLNTRYSEMITILDNLPFGILFIDKNLELLDFNKRVTQMLGKDNSNEIIKFLEDAVKNGQLCEFTTSKNKKPSKSLSKLTFNKQFSISPKKVLDEQCKDVVSVFNNKDLRQDSESVYGNDLKTILEKFPKLHQSQQTSVSRENLSFIIKMTNLNTSQNYTKYRSLRLKIFQLLGNNNNNNNQTDPTYLFIIENITKREEFKLLNHKYKFQQALLNSICHELRTPINGNISILYALKDEMPENLIKTHLEPAIVSAKRLLYQLNDILDYAQLQFSQVLNLNKTCFFLEEIYEQLKILFDFDCIQKQITLIFPEESQTTVYTDKERLTRIFINLIDNSIKFTDQGGTINVFHESNLNYHTFCIYDNGQGITNEIIENIVAQAEQLFEESTEFTSNKLGIGLRISQQIAKQLFSDQKFQILSEYGQFTKVFFRLSTKIQSISVDLGNNQLIITQTNSCSCPNILIVDDIGCNHLALQVLLKRFKLTADNAYNGDSAIQLVKKRLIQKCCQNYRLIFMDIEMPGKNGFQASSEIIELLKQHNLQDKTIIVMYSAYSDDDDVQLANQCGMKERISKPTEIKKLENIIKKYFSQ